MEPSSLTRRDAAAAAGLAALALLLRLLFLFSSADRGRPHSIYYEGDAPLWVEWMTAIQRGQPFEHDLPLHSPGVAYVLAGLAALPGIEPDSFVFFKVLWCLLSAATCGMTYLALAPRMGRMTALIAGGLLAFSFGQYVLATSLNNEAPYEFLLVLALMMTAQLVQRPRIDAALGLGAVHGAAALLRPEHFLLVVLLASGQVFWSGRAWLRQRKTATGGKASAARAPALLQLRATVLTLAAFFAVCLPWSIHGSRATSRFNAYVDAVPDYARAAVPWDQSARDFLDRLPAFVRGQNFQYCTFLAQRERVPTVTARYVRGYFEREFGYVPEPLSTFVFLSSQGPLSFALANHPSAGGGFSKAAIDARFQPDPHFNWALPSHLKLYNHGYAVGWSWIRADFPAWLGRVGDKLANFADGAALGFTARNLPYGAIGARRAVDLVAPPRLSGVFFKAALALLGALGLVVALRRRTGGFWLTVIVYKLIVTVLFYGYARQAVSIAPAIYAFVALGIASLVTALMNWFLAARVRRAGKKFPAECI